MCVLRVCVGMRDVGVCMCALQFDVQLMGTHVLSMTIKFKHTSCVETKCTNVGIN